MSKMRNFKYYANEQIDVGDFLQTFYNLPKERFQNMSHREIKIVLSYIKRVKNANVTREAILQGKVILVKDNNNVVLAYQNPFVNNGFDSQMSMCEENGKVIFTFSREEGHEHEDYDEELIRYLSDYELDQLLKQSKKEGEYRISRLVKKELHFRPDSKPGSRRKAIEKSRKRGGSINDQY